MSLWLSVIFFFFFNDTATTEIYTLSLHDALPICRHAARPQGLGEDVVGDERPPAGDRDADEGSDEPPPEGDRKSTRLNSSHSQISYAVFCLKKKKKQKTTTKR